MASILNFEEQCGSHILLANQYVNTHSNVEMNSNLYINKENKGSKKEGGTCMSKNGME